MRESLQCWSNWNGKLELSGKGQADITSSEVWNIKELPRKASLSNKIAQILLYIYTYLHAVYQLEIKKSHKIWKTLKSLQ